MSLGDEPTPVFRRSFGLLLAVLAGAVGCTLAFGTEALVALGLARPTAGAMLAVAVVAACLAGLALFALHGVDWSR